MWWLCGPRSCAQPVLGAEGSGQARLHPQAHRAMSTAPWAHVSPGTLLSRLSYRLSGVPSPHFLPFGVPPWPGASGTVHPGQSWSPAPTQTQGPWAAWNQFLHPLGPSGSGHTHRHTHVYTCTHTQAHTLTSRHMHTHTHPHIHTYIHTGTCTHRSTYTHTLKHRHTCTHTHTLHRQDWSGCCWRLQSPHGHSWLALPWGGSSRCQINWEKLTWADISEPSACSPKLF